jgi:hypothetical protein
MKKIWDENEERMEVLQQLKQDEIEKVIEEFSGKKYERKQEVKSEFDYLIKKLESAKVKNLEKIKKF